jgi:hypothetical protein
VRHKDCLGLTTTESGKFKYTLGHERIPDNWYKRDIGDEYTIPGFFVDTLDFGEKYPPLLGITGNAGKTDSLTIVDLGSLTKGVSNAGDLLKGNNLECYLLQVSQAAPPDIAGAESDAGNMLSSLTTTVAERLAGLAYQQLDSIDQNRYNILTGHNKCPHGYSGY